MLSLVWDKGGKNMQQSHPKNARAAEIEKRMNKMCYFCEKRLAFSRYMLYNNLRRKNDWLNMDA